MTEIWGFYESIRYNSVKWAGSEWAGGCFKVP
jgi:hypothetical protein